MKESSGQPKRREEPLVKPRSTRWLGWSLWLLTVVLLLLGAWFEALNVPTRGSLWQQSLGLVPLSLPFATVGALIATRQRQNPIGWLLCGFGLVVAMLLVGNQYSRYALVTAPGSLPAGDWAAWLAVWPVELTASLSILVLLLFPDGRSLSPRWRPLVWLAVTLGVVSAATSALSAVNFPGNIPYAQHPLQLLEAGTALAIYDTCAALFLGVQLAAVCSIVVRLRRARGDERQQLKWFAYVGAVGAVLVLAWSFVRPDPVIVALVWLPALAATVGIAIFRYRLYDIDRLINRTLVYGLLTTLLAGVYASVVLVLGQVFSGVGARSAELGGGRRDPGRRGPVPAGPPPHPGGRGSALQPPQVRCGQDRRGLQRPAAGRDRPGRPLGRAAGGGSPDHAADKGYPLAATLGTSRAAWSRTRKLMQAGPSMTPCMPCSFGLFEHTRSEADAPPYRPCRE
jgi:hypothetical protein